MKRNQPLNKLGEDFFNRHWGNERIIIHSQCVIDACLAMAKGTALDTKVFVIAGWIHDIGIQQNKETHHIISLEYLDEFLSENSQFISLKNELRDCILHHRSSGTPETDYGKIFKKADKIALLDKKWLDFSAIKPT
ncbi:HD domain-containing protein [Candidatus Woesearchaeota archaeon]|nr:HD domain-containing protein [Candidatus Woesearchaeota archaeon]